MLQKGFFMTEPFNPSPFWDNTIVNLSGAQKFEEDTVFPAGRYSVDVQAGSSRNLFASEGYFSGRVDTIITINSEFIIRAYCGGKTYPNSDYSAWIVGTNPYSGAFKVNPQTTYGPVDDVSHIFGNCGSMGIGGDESSVKYISSGNCLSDGAGAALSLSSEGIGAGSCLHIMPIGGVFGTDYLFAFHTASASGLGGGGSVYGGAGSGFARGYRVDHAQSSYSGGNTPYGNGGNGVTSYRYQYPVNGNTGSGIGAGQGGGPSYDANNRIGAAAWFNGIVWVNSGQHGGAGEDGHIIIKYLGTPN